MYPPPCHTDCASSGKSWPFKIFVKSNSIVHKYQPTSDFGYTTFDEATLLPVMVGQVVHTAYQYDKIQMLCQGIAMVRVANNIAQLSEQERFVMMAVYVTDQLVAERYLLYLPRKNDRHVSCHSTSQTNELTRASRSTCSARILT